MEKSFIDIFVGLADEADRSEAKKIAKVLEKNGVDSITHLIEMADTAIYNIRGIGDRAMHIISEIKTRECAKAKKDIASYKKKKGNQVPKDFKYYANKIGIPYLQACQLEKILKQNGVRDMDVFLKTSQEDISQWKGIGAKRLQWCAEIKGVASNARRSK